MSAITAARSMRSAFVAVALVLLAFGNALATSSMSFEAQGYLVDIVVGGDRRPTVAGLSFSAPGSQLTVEIPLRHVRTEAFDTNLRLLRLRFTNPGDAKLPKDFSLTVRNDAGVLRIEGKAFGGRFSWGQ